MPGSEGPIAPRPGPRFPPPLPTSRDPEPTDPRPGDRQTKASGMSTLTPPSAPQSATPAATALVNYAARPATRGCQNISTPPRPENPGPTSATPATTTSPAAGSAEGRMLAYLADRVGGRRYELWIQPSVRLSLDTSARALHVAVPNRFVADKVRSDFAGWLREAAAVVLTDDATRGAQVQMEVTIQPDRFTPSGRGNAAGTVAATGAAGPAASARSAVMGGARAGGLQFAAPSGAAGIDLARRRSAGSVRAWGEGFDPGLAAPLRYRLDDFVVGPCNELAYAAALALTPDPEAETGPAGRHDTPADRGAAAFAHDATTADGEAGADGLAGGLAGGGGLFVHGGCGVGKTHLLQGVCQRKLRQCPGARVLYTTAESFTNAYITAVRNNRLDSFRRQLRRLDLLAIDDVEFFANKDKTQQEFLHCFDHIELAGARVVMASDSHPKLIKRFSEALVSRCVQGLVVQVNPPDLATRRTLVQRLARRRGLVVQPGLEERIAAHAGASVRELEGVVAQLHALASLDQPQGPTRRVHRALVDKLVASQRELRSSRPVRFYDIQATVCQHFAVEPRQVAGSSRHRMVVLARATLIHLARQMTTLSFPEIATALGKSSHSTVVTAGQRMARQLEANEPLLLPGRAEPTTPVQLVEDLRQALLQRINGR